MNKNFTEEIKRMNREYYKDVTKEALRKATLISLWTTFGLCMFLCLSSITMLVINHIIL